MGVGVSYFPLAMEAVAGGLDCIRRMWCLLAEEECLYKVPWLQMMMPSQVSGESCFANIGLLRRSRRRSREDEGWNLIIRRWQAGSGGLDRTCWMKRSIDRPDSYLGHARNHYAHTGFLECDLFSGARAP